jgi:hypothetical protein
MTADYRASIEAMQPTSKLDAQQRFFWTHAAWSWGRNQTRAEGRTACAQRLAAAEAAYHDAEAYANYTFRIAPDHDCSEEGGPYWSMWIEDTAGRCVASLGGIDDDGETYRRVVRAELALECLDMLREAVAAEREEA